ELNRQHLKLSHLHCFNMTFMFFVFCFLHLLGNKGAYGTKQVHQTPSSIIKRAGQSVNGEISCTHSIPSYNRILWYKQNGDEFKFLGYLNLINPVIEDDVQGKISFAGDGRKHSNFSISNLAMNDGGIYFCAAS
ncbi:hypothetical protein INR49_013143, partial [Caranx melampygus]